jgi:hypothetical protein
MSNSTNVVSHVRPLSCAARPTDDKLGYALYMMLTCVQVTMLLLTWPCAFVLSSCHTREGATESPPMVSSRGEWFEEDMVMTSLTAVMLSRPYESTGDGALAHARGRACRMLKVVVEFYWIFCCAGSSRWYVADQLQPRGGKGPACRSHRSGWAASNGPIYVCVMDAPTSLGPAR